MSWRITATFTTVILSFMLTVSLFIVFATLLTIELQGAFETAIKIGPTDFIVKLIVFYMHERLWQVEALSTIYGKQFLKVALWKLLAVTMTMGTTIMITGEVALALKLGPMDFISKLLLYAAHDAIWNMISFGKLKEQ